MLISSTAVIISLCMCVCIYKNIMLYTLNRYNFIKKQNRTKKKQNKKK